MIVPRPKRAYSKVIYQLLVVLVFALSPLLTFSQTAHAATITLDEAKACYAELNGKNTLEATMTKAVCSQICVSDGTVWVCINPNATALTPDQKSNAVLDAKRLYGSSVGDAVCNQTIEQEKAGCVDYAKTVVIDCINAWVTSLSASQLQDFLITNINVDTVATCTAQKLNVSKSVVVSALNNAKSQVDDVVNQSVSDAENEAKQTCTNRGMTYSPNDSNADADGCVKTSVKICSAGALGWLLCPLVTMMNDINQFMAGQIEGILQVKTLTDTTSRVGIEGVWQVVVGIANLLLVVAFLIVIFSQATSIGLSAYGIKKMLPRIIAAAILINLSLFLGGLLIDISNVVGSAVKGIFTAVANGLTSATGHGAIPSTSDAEHIMLDIGGVLTVLIGVLATVGVAIAVEAVAFIVPVLIAGTFATIIFFLAIALRGVLITILVMIAPLAFAAMILPNTESLFKKWWSSFFKLLLMYPAMALIMYGSVFVAQTTLLSINSSDWVSGTFDPKYVITILLAYAIVALAPPIGTYMYLKSANKIIASVTGAVNKVGRGLTKGATGWAKKDFKRGEFATARDTARNVRDREAKIAALQQMGNTEEWGGGLFNPFNKASRRSVVRRTARAGLFMNKQAQGKLNYSYANAEDSVYKQEVEEAESKFKKMDNLDDLQQEFYRQATSRSANGAELHAIMNLMGGYAGSKTAVRQLMTDKNVMGGVLASGDQALAGVAKGWATNGKYGESNPDIKTRMEEGPKAYAQSVVDGTAQAGLRGNYAGMGTDGFRSWGWYAQRPSEIIKLSEKHTGQVFDKIKYQDAVTASKHDDFGKADPEIRYMINDIIAQGKADAAARTQKARDAAAKAAKDKGEEFDPGSIKELEPSADFTLNSDYVPTAPAGASKNWLNKPEIDKKTGKQLAEGIAESTLKRWASKT